MVIFEIKKHQQLSNQNPFNEYSLINCLGIFSALQAFPENGGKLVALQELSFTALKQGNESTGKLAYRDLQQRFFEHYRKQTMRVNPPQIFSTNITSVIGNTTILPGLFKGGSTLLQSLINVIFLNRLNSFPENFYHTVYSATYFILNVANAFAVENKIDAFGTTRIDFDSIFIPEEGIFETAYASCFSNKDAVIKLFEMKELDFEVVDQFVIQLDDLHGKFEDESNPFLLRPFYDTGTSLLLLSPVNLYNALFTFIWRAAITDNCIDQLNKSYHNEIGRDVLNAVFHLKWKRLSTGDFAQQDFQAFNIDVDKVGIVVYCPDTVTNESYNINNPVTILDGTNPGEQLTKRLTEINELLDTSEHASKQRMFIAVFGNAGRQVELRFDQPSYPFLLFPHHEWLWLCRADNSYHPLVLWYFIKSKDRFLENYETSGLSTFDLFALYMSHEESFYLSNESPDEFAIDGSLTLDFIYQAEKEAASFVLPYQDNSKPPPILIPVMLLDRFDSLYMPDPQTGIFYEYAVTGFPQTIWLKPSLAKGRKQFNDEEWAFHTEIAKMIAYWLKELKPHLSRYLDRLPFEVIDVFINFNDPAKFFHGETEIEQSKSVLAPVRATITRDGLLLDFNSSFAELLDRPDNYGERVFVETLIAVFNEVFLRSSVLKQLQPLSVRTVTDLVAPLGRKKKLTIFNTIRDARQVDKNLGRTGFLQPYHINRLLDELVGSLDGHSGSKLGEIKKKSQKLKVLSQLIFQTLVPKLRVLTDVADSESLLSILIGRYEKFVHKKKAQEINVATVKYTYPDAYKDKYLPEFKDDQGKLAESSIAYRCLIEFVCAEQRTGTTVISNEVIDEMLAIMACIVDLGIIHDEIYFELSDDNLAILPSGRIGFQRSFKSDIVLPYTSTKLDQSIEGIHEDFDDHFKVEDVAITASKTTLDLRNKVNDAYLEAYSFSLEDLINFMISLSNVGIRQTTAFSVMRQNEIIKKISEDHAELNSEKISKMIDLLSMTDRGNALTVPDGIDNYDASPWRFNRLLSYISKPLIVIKDNSGEQDRKIYFGSRHLVDAAEQIEIKIFEGRIRDEKLSGIKGHMLHRKGSLFNKAVAKLLCADSHLDIFEEVNLPEELGDIDVVVVDKINKRLYLLEAKSVTPSKIAKEMAEERDRFFGSIKEGIGWIEKHYKRYMAIVSDPAILEERLKVNLQDYIVLACFVTSQSILIQHLLTSGKYGHGFGMPFCTYGQLKEQGMNFLTGLEPIREVDGSK